MRKTVEHSANSVRFPLTQKIFGPKIATTNNNIKNNLIQSQLKTLCEVIVTNLLGGVHGFEIPEHVRFVTARAKVLL